MHVSTETIYLCVRVFLQVSTQTIYLCAKPLFGVPIIVRWLDTSSFEIVPRVLSVILSTTPLARALAPLFPLVVPLREQEALGSSLLQAAVLDVLIGQFSRLGFDVALSA